MAGKLIMFLLIFFIWRYSGTQCQPMFCLYITPKGQLVPGYKYSPVEVISTCDTIGMETEKALCRKPVDFSTSATYDVVPVTDTATDTAYINIHCALCNGAKRKRIHYWPLRIKCHGAGTVDLKNVNDIVKAVSKTEECEVSFGLSYSDPDSGQKRYECNLYIRNCYTVTTGSTNCFSKSPSFVVWRGLILTNTYCAECNGIPSDSVRPSNEVPSWTFTAWRLLPRTPADDTDEACQTMGSLSGSFQSSVQEDCLKTRCSPIRKLTNRTCVKIDQLTDTGTYAVCMRLKPLTNLTLQSALVHAAELYNNIWPMLEEVFGYYDSTTEVLFTSEYDFNQDILLARFKFFDWQIKLRKSARMDPESKLQKLLRAVRATNLSSWLDDTEVMYSVLLQDCTDLQVSATIYPDCLRVTYPHEYCDNMVDIITDTAKVTSKHLIFGVGIEEVSLFYDPFLHTYLTSESNILEFRQCQFVEVLIKETVWEETDAGLQFSEQGLFLPFSDFLYGHSHDSIWICRNRYYNIIANLRRNVDSAGYSANLSCFLLLSFHISLSNALVIIFFISSYFKLN